MIAVTLGLAYNWKLGLVCSVFMPMSVFGLFMELRLSMGLEEEEKNAFEESSKLAIEAIANVRTVQGLSCEQQYVQRFVRLLEQPHKKALIRNHKKAGLTMLSYCCLYLNKTQKCTPRNTINLIFFND